MPRPIKEGLDYFELDCRMDEKFELIEAEFGLKGFAVVIKLFQYIYGTHGYYCDWNPDISLLWASRLLGSPGGDGRSVGSVFSEEGALSGFPNNFINEVVAASIRRDIFSAELFEKYQILTSSGIQTRYINAVAKRSCVKLKKEYLLVNVPETKVFSVETGVFSPKTGVFSDRNSQSREEKIREKKSNSSSAPKARGPTATEIIKDRHFGPNIEPVVLEWVAYKTEKRQAYKETGLKNLLSQIEKKIQEHGEQPVIDVIRLSMSQNWQGIIWDRVNPGTPRSSKPNKFNNFEQRTYDYDELERQLMNVRK